MKTTLPLITAQNLLEMPNDGFRYELVKGELKKMAPAGFQHGRIAAIVTISLGSYVHSHQLGVVCAAETGFLITFNPDTVRAPDVAFISQKRLQEIKETKGFWPGTPDLAVEVISPNDIYLEVEEKVWDWLEAGTQMVLVINPRKRIATQYRSKQEIRVFSENESLDGGDVVPGWTLLIKDLFV
ncbi:MAG: Uma2 family endonuclease [Planctomycetota bacterium]